MMKAITMQTVWQGSIYLWEGSPSPIKCPTYRQRSQSRQQRNDYLLAALALAIGLAIASVCRGQCVGGACHQSPSMAPLTPPAEQVSPLVAAASCRVINRQQHGNVLGSGSLVAVRPSHGYILTCGHLLDGGVGRLQVVFNSSGQVNGKRFEAEVFAVDRPNDLALIRIAMPGRQPLAIDKGPINNERLTACGFGGKGPFRAVAGRAIGYATARGATAPSLQIRATVRSGDSGGPLVNQRDELVGVVWGVRNGVTYAMVGEPVRRLFARIGQSPNREMVAAKPPPAQRPPVEQPNGPACQCPADVVTQKELAGFLRSYLRRDEWLAVTEQAEASTRSELSSFRAFVMLRLKQLAAERLPTTASLKSLTQVQVVLASLGIGGPIGLGVLAAGWLLRRRRQKRSHSGGLGGPPAETFRHR